MRCDPHETQTFSPGCLPTERGDLRGDEDVEDFVFRLADDGPLRVDERPVVAEALDDIELLTWIALGAAARPKSLRDGLGVDDRFDHLARRQSVGLHFLASLFGEPYPSPHHRRLIRSITSILTDPNWQNAANQPRGRKRIGPEVHAVAGLRVGGAGLRARQYGPLAAAEGRPTGLPTFLTPTPRGANTEFHACD